MDEYSELIKIVESIEISQEKLKELSKHTHYGIRYRIARHNNTSTETLSSLSKDNTISVRYEVAKNKNTDLKDLVFLLNDRSSLVVTAAKENIETKIDKNINTPITTGIKKVKLISEYF